jgi:CRP-like cAMP-binding protein
MPVTQALAKAPPHAPGTNALIAVLPRKDRLQLLAACEPVTLVFAEALSPPDGKTRHVYFPTGGFISLIAVADGNTHIEVGLIGDEGMLGIPAFLGVNMTPLQAMVQGAGPALRIGTAAFRNELDQSPALRARLSLYVSVVHSQLAQTAACNRFHVVQARLARWLLMTQDRSHAHEFSVTHEFLSYMLGVRRVGVTAAATALQGLNLISHERGKLTILDRTGLQAAACGCYQADCDTYARVLGRRKEQPLH